MLFLKKVLGQWTVVAGESDVGCLSDPVGARGLGLAIAAEETA
jgi:hypothetical protein